MNTKHAILYRHFPQKELYLVYGKGDIVIHFEKNEEPIALYEMAKYCEIPNGITHLWIHPSADLHKGPPEVYEMEARGYDCLPSYDGTNHVASLHAYKRMERGRSQRFNIIFLEYCSWDWKDLNKGMLSLVEELEKELNVPVGGSPSGVGMRYLEKYHEKKKYLLQKPEIDLSSIPFNQSARPLIWQRQPDREEIEKKYLYAFDKNACYPRAALEESFGVGEPEHRGGCEFDHILPGIWRVDILHSPDLDDRLPSPVWRDFDWLATPIVKLLKKMGHEISVREAWIFPGHARIFRGWVENLWDYRKASMGPKKDAYKAIMNDTLGLTRSSKLGTNTYKYRPDWNAQIVAGARAVMMYNIIGYAQNGYYPIMCQLDALYYLSNEDLPGNAVPGILAHSSSLGGYKLKFKIDTSETEEGMTVRAILASNMAQSQKLRLLNKIAERAGY